MTPLIIGHRDYSRKHHPWGVGEMTELVKVQRVLTPPCEAIDVYELFERAEKFYYAMGRLNIDLAFGGHEAVHTLPTREAKHILKLLRRHAPERLIVLSWEYALGALLAAGAHTLCPLVAKLYVFHDTSIVPASLYANVELVIAETPLSIHKGHEAGIPIGQMLYLPHSHTPKSVTPAPSYLEKLAWENGKTLEEGRVVIGVVSRLKSWKNCLAAFEAAEALAERGEEFLFVLKGNFEGEQLEIAEKLLEMIHYPWFLWDQHHTPFPEVLSEFAHFDVLLNISGREGANNTTIECLSIGIPVVLLEGSSNPYVFKEAAIFVPCEDEMLPDHLVPYRIPVMEPLVETLSTLVRDPLLRAEWGRKGQEIARARFSPKHLEKRLPLLFEKPDSGVLEKLYEEDRKLYALD